MFIFIALVSLLLLIVVHELGHFALAKKFRVKVEEFGIGIPPRVLGKKLGETMYSFNLLPVGAFVRLEGEEKEVESERSFSRKPIWQRALIVVGGVVAGWLAAFFLFGVTGAVWGIPVAIPDDFEANIQDPKVQIIGIVQNSPAQDAGLQLGDIIVQVQAEDQESVEIRKVTQVQEFTQSAKGNEIVLSVLRGGELVEIPVIPRLEPPSGEGPIGIALARTALMRYPWYEAPFQGVIITGRVSWEILRGLGDIGSHIFSGKGVPPGVELMGPVGVFDTLRNSLTVGAGHFIYFVALISVYLAIFNTLPLPVLDGGKLLFLGIEAFRKKPLPRHIEQNVSAVFVALLISLMIWVTIGDLRRIF